MSPSTGIMGGDRNTVHLITGDGVESWPDQERDRPEAPPSTPVVGFRGMRWGGMAATLTSAIRVSIAQMCDSSRLPSSDHSVVR